MNASAYTRAEVQARLAEKFMLSDGTYPFRRKCPNMWCQEGTGCYCKGTGYVFNPDVIWEAVLAKGGTLRGWIDHTRRDESQTRGKFVAECRLGSEMNQPQLGRADSMAEALELVVLRAWEGSDGS